MTVKSSSETKAAVSIAEMARMVGLSRQRFHQLIGTAFPYPVYFVSNRRPYYDQAMQQTCLEVRRTNCGIDGQPILFYPPRNSPAPTNTRKPKRPKNDQYAYLLDGLHSLGLPGVTAAQVSDCVKQLFPAGTSAVDQAEVIRAVFIHMKRKNSADNVG